MAGKAKSVYLTVTTMDHKSVFHRMFFNAKEYNEFVNTDEFKSKYPEAFTNLNSIQELLLLNLTIYNNYNNINVFVSL